MPVFRGASRIAVVSADPSAEQRVTVKVAGGRDVVVPARAGQTAAIDADRWELVLEHLHEGGWRQNIVAVMGKWTPAGETESQLIRSRTHDGAPRLRGDSLVLRVERRNPAWRPPPQAAVPAPASSRPTVESSRGATDVAAAPPRIFTSSGGNAAKDQGRGHRPDAASGGPATTGGEYGGY